MAEKRYATRTELKEELDFRGVEGALLHGIASQDMPDEPLALAWHGLEKSFEQYNEATNLVLNMLHE